MKKNINIRELFIEKKLKKSNILAQKEFKFFKYYYIR